MAAGGPGGHLDAPWVISKFRQNARTRHGACSLIIGMRVAAGIVCGDGVDGDRRRLGIERFHLRYSLSTPYGDI